MSDATRSRRRKRAGAVRLAGAAIALAGAAAAPFLIGPAALDGVTPRFAAVTFVVAAALMASAFLAAARMERAAASDPSDPNKHPLDPFAMSRPTALLALENAPDPILLIDADARIRLVNAAARDFLGRDALGKRISAVFRSPVVLAACERILNGGEAYAVDYTLLVPVERHLRASVAPVAPEGVPGLPADERRSALVTIHDLTSQRRAERMHSDFVANASHELRTPLAALKGFVETLQGPAKDDEEARERFLAIMADQAVRMEALIEGLLSLSRIELYEHVPPSGRIDLGDIAREAADAFRLMEPRAASRVRFACPDDALPMVGEREELMRVCHNLIGNACKYGGDGAVDVRVGVGERNDPDLKAAGGASVFVGDMTAAGVRGEALCDYRHFSVRDHGVGIAREHLPRLTERFFQVDEGAAGRGTGLGLAIVKHIVNRHQGVLQIESAVDQGSAFTVYFPPPGEIIGPEAREVSPAPEAVS